MSDIKAVVDEIRRSYQFAPFVRRTPRSMSEMATYRQLRRLLAAEYFRLADHPEAGETSQYKRV